MPPTYDNGAKPNRDLLDRLLTNQVARTLIAIAIILFTVDTIYDAATSVVRGFQAGFAGASRAATRKASQ